MKLPQHELPSGWDVEYTERDEVSVRKTFPDGTDVLLKLQRQASGYVLTSSAEARTSGPSTSTVGVFASEEESARALLQECAGWERHVRSPQEWDLGDLTAL